MSNQRGAPPKVPRLTVTVDSDDMRIIFDKPAQRLRIMKLDGGGLPIGRIEEHTFADALNILHEFSGPLAQQGAGSTGAPTLSQKRPASEAPR